MPKTLALVEQLEAINPYLNYETYTERVIPANVKRLFLSATSSLKRSTSRIRRRC